MVSKSAWQHYQLGNVLISESHTQEERGEWNGLGATRVGVSCKLRSGGHHTKIYANECEKSDWGSEHGFQICKTVKSWSLTWCTRDGEMNIVSNFTLTWKLDYHYKNKKMPQLQQLTFF